MHQLPSFIFVHAKVSDNSKYIILLCWQFAICWLVVQVLFVVSLLFIEIGQCYHTSLSKQYEANDEPARETYHNRIGANNESTTLSIHNLAGNEFKLPRNFPIIDFLNSASCGKHEYVENVTTSNGCHSTVTKYFCYGLCSSITALSSDGKPVPYYRTYCSPSKTKTVQVKLHCPHSMTHVKKSVTIVDECHCQQN